MTELNPAAEAERLAKLAVAEGAQIGDFLKTDAESIKTDLTGDVEKVAAEVKPVETVAKTDADTVETDVKTDTTTAAAAIRPARRCRCWKGSWRRLIDLGGHSGHPVRDLRRAFRS
jgi:hypothetical protein